MTGRLRDRCGTAAMDAGWHGDCLEGSGVEDTERIVVDGAESTEPLKEPNL